MKRNEIALLLIIVGLAALTSYFLINSVVKSNGSQKPVNVKVASPISTTVTQPNQEVFNKNALNPTVKVKIGDQSNSQPFNGQ